MLEIDIAYTSVTLSQLLHQVETGEEMLLLRYGKPIARLSAVSLNPQPLASHKELRDAQSQTTISSLQTLQSLRREARY
jgi:antitoxin (DNA-binding transcriptional repressor) of toxin-antitoxin stability system